MENILGMRQEEKLLSTFSKGGLDKNINTDLEN